jgi:hypothetical protein
MVKKTNRWRRRRFRYRWGVLALATNGMVQGHGRLLGPGQARAFEV